MHAVKSMSTALSLSAVLLSGCADSGPAGPPPAASPPAALGLAPAQAARLAVVLEDARARILPALGDGPEVGGLSTRLEALSAAVNEGDAHAFAAALATAEQVLRDLEAHAGVSVAADVEALRRHLAESRTLVFDQ